LPPDLEDQAEGPEKYANSLDALDDAEEAMHAYVKLEPDEIDRAAGTQVLHGIVKLKAKDQRDRQSGNTASLARALQGATPPGAGPLG
jgi:hypothetical protein